MAARVRFLNWPKIDLLSRELMKCFAAAGTGGPTAAECGTLPLRLPAVLLLTPRFLHRPILEPYQCVALPAAIVRCMHSAWATPSLAT